MKKTLRLLGITAIAAIIGFGFASCEGQMGLQGPGGNTGAAALVRVEVGGNAAPAGVLDYVGDASYLINFGSTLVPAEFADSRNLTITNTGTATLPITLDVITGHFVVGETSFTLAPGAYRTIVVTRPSVDTTVSPQPHQSTLRLSSTVTGFDDIEIVARLWVGPDTAALRARILEAQTLVTATTQAAAATAVPEGSFWATEAHFTTINGAIAAAVNARNTAATQAAVTSAAGDIAGAITTFRNEHRRPGERGVIEVTPYDTTAWYIGYVVTPTSGAVLLPAVPVVAPATSTARFNVPTGVNTAGVSSLPAGIVTTVVAEGVLTITGVVAGTTDVTITLADRQDFVITAIVPAATGPTVSIVADSASVNVNSDTGDTATVTFTITGSNLPTAITAITNTMVTIPGITISTFSIPVTAGNVATTDNTFTITVPAATPTGPLVATLDVEGVPNATATVTVNQQFQAPEPCDCYDDVCNCAGDCDCYQCADGDDPCLCDDNV